MTTTTTTTKPKRPRQTNVTAYVDADLQKRVRVLARGRGVSVSRFTKAALLGLADAIEADALGAAVSPPDNNEEGAGVK